jgi:NAD(P)-dependent dehydrogenase (short-subunit alcohol dehydrogenase family)
VLFTYNGNELTSINGGRMQSFSGKLAIVTGASGGIGLATATVLAERGATVVLTATRLENVRSACDALVARGLAAEPMALDLADESSVAALMIAVIARHGRIDVLHNNAADLSVTMQDQNVETMTLAVWDRVFRVNVRGTMLCCHHALPHMVRRGRGSIINTASALGLFGADVQAAYAASKAAVMQLTRSIAVSHGKQGIRCNAVVPGLIATQAARDNLPPMLWRIQESENLTPYVGVPEDIAYTVAFLASDEARYITGQSIVVDGGAGTHIAGMAQLRALGAPPRDDATLKS